jgi:hypothetical protein
VSNARHGLAETLIYYLWNISISDLNMPFPLETDDLSPNIHSNLLFNLLHSSRIIIGTIRGNVSAANILKEALCATRDLGLRQILLALGPTSPLSLETRHQRIIWVTYLDEMDIKDCNDPVIVSPSHLTDLSITFEKEVEKGSVRLLLGDFLDSTLTPADESALFPFLSKFLSRIRESRQTAFFLVTEDMHDARKLAMVKRFADVVIEYRQGIRGDNGYDVETRILDHAGGHYGAWQRSEPQDRYSEEERLFTQWPREVEVRQ